ncbi:MAG TPA: nucleotidyl transferase AbiEii/AbiGii toxin family protein [Thermoanaerobaculia bacterium]|nr:nucleotidyl transferase AbiEii/AbiGii toxin family protein [Thermoanaerobaculia bacterium]
MEFEEAKRILRALESEGVRYVLVGSMAMAAQGLVRATRDMDFFVASDPDNVERLRRALRSVFGADPNLDQITTEDLAGDYPAIEYVPPQRAYSLDILSRLGEVYRYEQLEAEDVIVDGVRIRVATPRMLYRMKRDTVRPLDRIDAEAIRERFGLREDD